MYLFRQKENWKSVFFSLLLFFLFLHDTMTMTTMMIDDTNKLPPTFFLSFCSFSFSCKHHYTFFFIVHAYQCFLFIWIKSFFFLSLFIFNVILHYICIITKRKRARKKRGERKRNIIFFSRTRYFIWSLCKVEKKSTRSSQLWLTKYNKQDSFWWRLFLFDRKYYLLCMERTSSSV